jgi:hypothetical protein
MLSKKGHQQQTSHDKAPHQQTSREMVKFVELPATTVILSTMTSEDICKPKSHNNVITRISDTQIQDITNVVSQRYDSVIQRMQEAHEIQIKSIIQTQKLQDNEIYEIKMSQKQLREDMQYQLDKKMNSHTQC